MNCEKVEVVNEMKYLGHMLYNNRQNSMTTFVKNDFVSKANICLADFKGLNSNVKHNLIDKFCSSFYGVSLCSLDNTGFDDICTAWRKVMRRVWNIPNRTHNVLLPHIAMCIPPDVFLLQRFIGFFYDGILSINSVLSNMFYNSLHYSTRLGNNMRYVFEKCGYYFRYFNTTTCFMLKNACLRKWAKTFTDNDVYKGRQIRELIKHRDSRVNWLLNSDECQTIITNMCTE